jgi:hypothetical protein
LARHPVRVSDFRQALAACSDCAVSAQAVARASSVDQECRDSPVGFSVGPALPVFQDPKQAVVPSATAVLEPQVCPAFRFLDSAVVPELGDPAFPVSGPNCLHVPASTDLDSGSALPARPDSELLVLMADACPALGECSEAQAAVKFPDHPAFPDEGRNDMVDDIRADDSANCRDIPGGSTIRSAGDDTTGAAGDTDSPILPSKHDCSRRAAHPSSNPIHPSPRAGW